MSDVSTLMYPEVAMNETDSHDHCANPYAAHMGQNPALGGPVYRFVQSPIPLYLNNTSYADPSPYLEVAGYTDPVMLANGNPSISFYTNLAGKDFALAYGHDGNNLVLDPMHGAGGQSVAYGYLQPGYFDNGSGGFPGMNFAYLDNPGMTLHQSLASSQHASTGSVGMRSAHGIDPLTPYSSELGAPDIFCGSSSEGTGTSSPAPPSQLLQMQPTMTFSDHMGELYPPSAHVRPLDVITPELFQAIHAPAFYKSTSQQLPAPTAFFLSPSYIDAHSGSNSVHCSGSLVSANGSSDASGSHNGHGSYVPPINSISSITFQQPAILASQGSFQPGKPLRSHSERLGEPQDASLSQLSQMSRPQVGAKEMLPTVTGPDGQVYQKPPGSYASLITKALRECESGKMTLSGIYDWIKSNYPYYQTAEAAWQVSHRVHMNL